MCEELTSTSSLGIDQDSNPQPHDCKAQTVTPTPPCYPTTPPCYERQIWWISHRGKFCHLGLSTLFCFHHSHLLQPPCFFSLAVLLSIPVPFKLTHDWFHGICINRLPLLSWWIPNIPCYAFNCLDSHTKCLDTLNSLMCEKPDILTGFSSAHFCLHQVKLIIMVTG